jgi:ornithine cyclodeaminase
MPILIFNHAEINELLPMKDCIAVMREALTALAQGEVFQPLRTIVRPPKLDGLIGLMPSFISGERTAIGLKAISVFPGNAAKGKDIHQGVVLLLSPETGELMAMMNASAITAIRTAAVSAVATDLLANKGACELAIVGAGVQARSHLKAMAEVRPIKRCRIAARNIENARDFAAEMQDEFSFPIEPAETVKDAVKNADIIVTATTSSEPVLERNWISPGAHMNAVGASTPNAREIDSQTMAAAKLFVDRRESTVNESGDYLFALQDGSIKPDHIRAEIGELLIGEKPGRTSGDEITLFKSLGLAVEDVAAADYLYNMAKESGIGTWANF